MTRAFSPEGNITEGTSCVSSTWVLGGYAPQEKKGFTNPSSTEGCSYTLIPIIQQWIVPGSTIHSDMWAAYNGERNPTSTKGRSRWKSSSGNYLLIAEVRFKVRFSVRVVVRVVVRVRDSKTIFHEKYFWWMSNCVFRLQPNWKYRLPTWDSKRPHIQLHGSANWSPYQQSRGDVDEGQKKI